MEQHQGYAADILNEAERLIAKVQGDLDDADTFYKSIGVNAAKVAGVLEPLMGLKQFQEVERLVAADHAAIDQEVAEEAARLNAGTSYSGSVRKKSRAMI